MGADDKKSDETAQQYPNTEEKSLNSIRTPETITEKHPNTGETPLRIFSVIAGKSARP